MPSPELHAELYSSLHRGQAGDVAHYRRLSAGCGRVLELGCGYGRVAIALAREACAATGVDCDDALLGLARAAAANESVEVRQRLTWLRGDMAQLGPEVVGPFERVLIPYSGLLCLLSPARVASCLRGAADRLASGGVLAFDVYSAEVLHQQEQDGEDDDYELVVELALDERRYHVLERSEWRRAEQRLDTHYLFVADDGARYASSIEQRYLLLGEIPALLDACGFDLTQLDGGFAGEPVDGESDTLVVVATKR